MHTFSRKAHFIYNNIICLQTHIIGICKQLPINSSSLRKCYEFGPTIGHPGVFAINDTSRMNPDVALRCVARAAEESVPYYLAISYLGAVAHLLFDEDIDRGRRRTKTQLQVRNCCSLSMVFLFGTAVDLLNSSGREQRITNLKIINRKRLCFENEYVRGSPRRAAEDFVPIEKTAFFRT